MLNNPSKCDLSDFLDRIKARAVSVTMRRYDCICTRVCILRERMKTWLSACVKALLRKDSFMDWLIPTLFSTFLSKLPFEDVVVVLIKVVYFFS